MSDEGYGTKAKYWDWSTYYESVGKIKILTLKEYGSIFNKNTVHSNLKEQTTYFSVKKDKK